MGFIIMCVGLEPVSGFNAVPKVYFQPTAMTTISHCPASWCVAAWIWVALLKIYFTSERSLTRQSLRSTFTSTSSNSLAIDPRISA